MHRIWRLYRSSTRSLSGSSCVLTPLSLPPSLHVPVPVPVPVPLPPSLSVCTSPPQVQRVAGDGAPSAVRGRRGHAVLPGQPECLYAHKKVGKICG